jgi:hypothetical protein
MEYLFLVGVIAGVVDMLLGKQFTDTTTNHKEAVPRLFKKHFAPVPVIKLSISKREFPFRVRADLQKTINTLFGSEYRILHFSGIKNEYKFSPPAMVDCILESQHNSAHPMPPEYEELDTGDEALVRVLKDALWLLERDGFRLAVMLSQSGNPMEITGLQIEVATPNTSEGTSVTHELFSRLEQAVAKGTTYRGKVLSLKASENPYSGKSTGIAVHKLRTVDRDQVILPQETLLLLERNVIEFAKNREKLAQAGLSKKKGILFYGPPGTGKTHTIHHLALALKGHTTLIIAAEQVALLSEYMTLARLLQPSTIVIEDVDLIAKDRTTMSSPCEEALLNKLLNEMDGLTQDADIFFILTTNRPQILEDALANRPGRIDQAIEFLLPDTIGRRKLVKLYGAALQLDNSIIDRIVTRTEGVSAAFLKELMRRSAQFAIERNNGLYLNEADVDAALDEMLFKGGLLNRKLLGASDVAPN